ncbi:uncharacterized protein BDV14DRAFT_172226 [Aspergillus stella-maris]|uniref:uncharacterized protein n=1 Tax=Aspergillus stella-maris TaxID=1810926 RepID=UPI003CCD80D1
MATLDTMSGHDGNGVSIPSDRSQSHLSRGQESSVSCQSPRKRVVKARQGFKATVSWQQQFPSRRHI